MCGVCDMGNAFCGSGVAGTSLIRPGTRYRPGRCPPGMRRTRNRGGWGGLARAVEVTRVHPGGPHDVRGRGPGGVDRQPTRRGRWGVLLAYEAASAMDIRWPYATPATDRSRWPGSRPTRRRLLPPNSTTRGRGKASGPPTRSCGIPRLTKRVSPATSRASSATSRPAIRIRSITRFRSGADAGRSRAGSMLVRPVDGPFPACIDTGRRGGDEPVAGTVHRTTW